MNAGSEHDRGLTRGICEMTLETRDPASLADGARQGVGALASGDGAAA